jgi:murein DD-endopeptidase MepM/ murein hydrolase activator NlpD
MHTEKAARSRKRRHASGRTEALARIANRRFVAAFASFWVFGALLLGSVAVRRPAETPGIGKSDYPSGDELAPLASAQEQPEDLGLYYTAYCVRKGDTVSGIAEAFGVTTDTIISFNGIKRSRGLQVGQVLKVPSTSGIMYEVKAGDSLGAIAASYEISSDRIVEMNGLMRIELDEGSSLFLPDAKLASFQLREINGDLFKKPVPGWITSWYGWRADPFTGERSFHNGIDIGISFGYPVRAAMEGRVSATGYSSGSGNYVLLNHHDGYQSFYGHLSKIIVQPGERVALGDVVGNAGSTGYSTGPHVHFSVYKNGRTLNPAVVMH